MQTLAEIAKAIRKLHSATIFTHTRPDGDTLGSALALWHALQALGIPCEVVCDEPIPEKFLFMEGIESIRRTPALSAEGYICVDASDENRLGDLGEVFLAGTKRKITVNVDHHVSNTMYAKYNYMRPVCANCYNMAELIPLLGVEIDEKIANALMLGLITDSGNFTHSDVDGAALRMAGELVERGAKITPIHYQVFQRQSAGRAALYGRTMSAIRYLLDGRFAVITITQEMLASTGTNKSDTEGFVDFPLSVDGVEVAAAILEFKPRQYKVSFRSKGKVNVNEVAGTFGGGGHVLASGCMIFGEEEEVIDRLRFAVSRRISE